LEEGEFGWGWEFDDFSFVRRQRVVDSYKRTGAFRDGFDERCATEFMVDGFRHDCAEHIIGPPGNSKFPRFFSQVLLFPRFGLREQTVDLFQRREEFPLVLQHGIVLLVIALEDFLRRVADISRQSLVLQGIQEEVLLLVV